MPDDDLALDPHAREVLAILDAGEYVCAGVRVPIREAQAAAERGTKLHTPAELAQLRERAGARGAAPPIIEVVDATTQAAACSLAARGPVALLNFASGRNPGGGFLVGARAQEEDLCRCSGLHRTLLTQPAYYAANRACGSFLYTDHVIESPGVPFFRIDTRADFLERPFLATVITAPAPDRSVAHGATFAVPLIRETFERRWANVLAIAEQGGRGALVLGAWGCGAFRNEPEIAAETAEAVLGLPRFERSFERVVFAIPNRGPRGSANFAAFRRVFG